MDSTKLKNVFDQIEYYSIRLLLLALLLISASKLLERELHGADSKERSVSRIAPIQCGRAINSGEPVLVCELWNIRVAEGYPEKAAGNGKTSPSSRRPRLIKIARTRTIIVSRSQE